MKQAASRRFICGLCLVLAFSAHIRYASPNQTELPFINQADLENPIIYPPANIRDRLFYVVDVGTEANQLYEEAFEAILEAHGK